MTSSHMPKAVYIEDVIERVLQYTKFHLQNTLYPQYDPVYRVDPHGGEYKVKNNTSYCCDMSETDMIAFLVCGWCVGVWEHPLAFCRNVCLSIELSTQN